MTAAPDCGALYGTGWRATGWTFDGALRRVWDESIPGEQRHDGNGGGFLTAAGEYVAAVSNRRNRTWLHTRDAATGAFRGEEPLADALVGGLTLLPGGNTLVFIRFQEHNGPTPPGLVAGARGGRFEVVQRATDGSYLTALAAHPSGRWLAVGRADGLVRVFDTHSWNEVTAYQWAQEPVGGLAFAPDGLKAAAGFGNEGKFVVWDVDL